jgi:hypothetical protein
VGGSEAKKGPGSDLFFLSPDFFFFMVFFYSTHRETPKKRDKENRQKSVLDFCRFFCKTFFVVSLNSHRCETPENAIKPKKNRGKTDIGVFVGFFFKLRHGLFAKTFFVVFLNSSYRYRETPKNVPKKKARKKKSAGGWV